MFRTYLDVLMVEYSLTQKAFSVLPIKEMVKRNCKMIFEHGISNDYLVIGVARDEAEAQTLIDYFQKQLENR